MVELMTPPEEKTEKGPEIDPRTRNMMLLHVGGKHVDENELRKVETPEPTKTHVPVPHHHYLDLVREAVPNYGLEMTGQLHALSKDGQVYFGLMQLAATVAPGVGFVMGLRNSHDKSVATGLVSGTRVFVCDNICFSGEVKIMRKHTSRILIDLPRLVDKAVGDVKALEVDEGLRVESYRNMELAEEQAKALTLDMCLQGAFAPSQATNVWSNYVSPAQEDFEERNLWSLYNAATETYKGKGMNATFTKGRALTRFLDGVSGVREETILQQAARIGEANTPVGDVIDV